MSDNPSVISAANALEFDQPHWKVIARGFKDETEAWLGVQDAHLAAVLRRHGVTRLYTNNRDFRKFDFLEAVDPLV
jgi:predicted nucleic acid-binding protein